ncbi:MAG: nicotinate phosphoribosyltransferase [Deltaproteobacteria bacterium]|nr:nicotinate phosphoribosyltransferase [Deltaproteobacteria bacterium]
MRSVLETDGYKLSMAEAGWPLRRETFYFGFRQGGPAVMPLDVAAHVRTLLPAATEADYDYLAAHGYPMGAGFRGAIGKTELIRVDAIPAGAIFYPGEPAFSVTGPSALVSWLEPLVLQLHFRIQLASVAQFEPEKLPSLLGAATCEPERTLIREVLDRAKVAVPSPGIDDGYRARVRETAAALVAAVGDGSRIFEVGMRSASCPEQHLLALEGCKQGGVTKTSNVFGAQKLGMTPVGTMGHEHVQRYGSDALAFRAMRDRRPERSSYLLDTYDTLGQGLPAAYDLMLEEPKHGDSIRFDSGDKAAQLRVADAKARTLGLEPIYVIEDGLNLERTRALEEVRRELHLAPERLFYGFGGELVSCPSEHKLTRDRVGAIWKLCETANTPTMKFANSPGKQSLPGRPVVWRRVSGSGPIGIVAQNGETPPAGYVRLTGATQDLGGLDRNASVEHSAETKALEASLTAKHFPPYRGPGHLHSA